VHTSHARSHLIRSDWIRWPWFNLKAKYSPATLSAKAVSMPTADGTVPGVLVNEQDLPAGIPFYRVEIYYDIRRSLNEVSLSVEDVHRSGQAADQYFVV